MKMIVCSVYDSATQAYMRPWFAQTEGQALRIFADEVMREGSELGAHPEDFSLFILGLYTDHDGSLMPEEPRSLARAHELKARNRQEQ